MTDRFSSDRNRSPVFAVPRIGGTAISQARPLRSTVGLGCHPSQVAEFNEAYRRHGAVCAYHEPDGTCVLESRQSRNKVMEARGLHDNDGGYGDYTGPSSSVTK